MSSFIKNIYKDLSSRTKIQQFKSFKKSIAAEKNNATASVLFQLHHQKNIPLDIIKHINSFIARNDNDEYYQALVGTIHMYGFYGNHIHVWMKHDVSWHSYTYENNVLGDNSRYFLLQPSAEYYDFIEFRPNHRKDKALIKYFSQLNQRSSVRITPGTQIPDQFKPILDEFLPAIEKRCNFSFNSIVINYETVCLIDRTYEISTINDIESLLPLLDEVKDKKLKKAILNQLIIKASCFWHTIKKTSNFVLRKTDTIIMHPGVFKKVFEKSKGNNQRLDWNLFYYKTPSAAKNLTRHEKFIIKNVTIYERLGTFTVTPTDVGYPHFFVKIQAINTQ
jgi:hypothetical protein